MARRTFRDGDIVAPDGMDSDDADFELGTVYQHPSGLCNVGWDSGVRTMVASDEIRLATDAEIADRWSR